MESQKLYSYRGVVIRKQSYSVRLLFVDICDPLPSSEEEINDLHYNSSTRKELIFRQDTYWNGDILTLKRKLGYMDFIAVTGFFDREKGGALMVQRLDQWERPAKTVDPCHFQHLRRVKPISPSELAENTTTMSESVAVCKHWLNQGGKCPRIEMGEECLYRHYTNHPGGMVGERKAFVRARREYREKLALDRIRSLTASPDENDSHKDTRLVDVSHSIRGHTVRAQLLGEWIENNLGWVVQKGPSLRVLDVAGGAGDLSLELWLRFGAKCTVVDPRMAMASDSTTECLSKKHLARVHNFLCAHGEEKTAGGYFLTTADSDDSRIGGKLYQTKKKRHLKATKTPFKRWVQRFDRAFVEGTSMKDFDLVVGLHPDEATDGIVDIALESDTPFVLMPCCVFYHLFRYRRHKGKEVRTYAELVDYLQAKDPRIGRDSLDVVGANIVLFSVPTVTDYKT